MPPIVSIVGRSKSGKTTLVEKLIAELKSRGYRVATMKHTPGGMSCDTEKDSERHLKAGSEAALVVAPDRITLFKPVKEISPLEQLGQLLGEDYDIILTEGFKQGDAPKIEVHRKANATPLEDIKKIFAIATDEPLDTKARQFSLEDIKGIVDLLEEGFIKPQKERLSLLVNDEPVVLSVFPRDFMTNVLLAMANSLKGVSRVKTMKIFLKRGE